MDPDALGGEAVERDVAQDPAVPIADGRPARDGSPRPHGIADTEPVERDEGVPPEREGRAELPELPCPLEDRDVDARALEADGR